MWRLRQLFRLVLASPSARWSMVVAAGGAGGIGEPAGTAARLFTTETYMSGTLTGAAATMAAIAHLVIPAIGLQATPVIDPAIRGIVHREAIPATDALRPQPFPHLRTQATVPAADRLRLSPLIPETGRATIRARGPVAADRLRLSPLIPETGRAKPRPHAPVPTRLAVINARKHRILPLLLRRRGPTLCLGRVEDARKVRAGAKVWAAAAIGEARVVNSQRRREFLCD
jgi:hypothetical protein